MEVISSILDRSNICLESQQLVLQDIKAKQAAESIGSSMHDSQLWGQEEEGEIIHLAKILLQLHGVKVPESSPSPSEEDPLNKKKRQRTSPDQLAILEQIFQTDKMPNQQTRVHLADKLGMSSRRVQIWFQNKRAKVKRGGKDDYEDSGSSPRRLSISELSDGNSSPTEFSSSSSSPSDAPLSSSLCNLTSTALPFASLSSSSIPISMSTSVAQTPFHFSAPKQFSLSSFEPKSNLLPDFASPSHSVAQSII